MDSILTNPCRQLDVAEIYIASQKVEQRVFVSQIRQILTNYYRNVFTDTLWGRFAEMWYHHQRSRHTSNYLEECESAMKEF